MPCIDRKNGECLCGTEKEKGQRKSKEATPSTRDATVNNGPAALANNSSVEQAQANAEREPEDAGKDPEDAKTGRRDMAALLQTDHLWVVGRQWCADDVPGCLVLVKVWSSRAHCIALLRGHGLRVFGARRSCT